MFELKLKTEALQQTIAYLEQSGSPVLQKFADQIVQKSQTAGVGFSMAESGAAIEDRPAGYVRTQGHIIMDYAVMNRDDWLFLFLHEFSHYVDPDLTDAVAQAVTLNERYPTIAKDIVGWANSVSRFEDLTKDQQYLTDVFLTLALRRGWIAEITAWASTLALYEELKTRKLIAPIDWAEAMVRQKQASETWSRFFADYLASRFIYPHDGIYSNPILRARSDGLEQSLIIAIKK